jgi:GNAT superfamily N-acetyltransferase
MPAAVDDPASPTIHRVSGQPPFPDPNNPILPPDIVPRQVTLRDRQTVATIVPFASRHQIPVSLVVYLCAQINKEIEGGDTYPLMDPFTADGFADFWFQNFGAVMLLGSIESADHLLDGKDWAKECLGSFYIRPNYPGRSSHVCNGGFLVTDASRNRGAGRLMGETYIDWAPRLGYTYSVFNLVYETNVASCKIWDALGFKRIGRVKGCGNLKSYPDRLIDAIIYGRDLAPGETEELVSEERFDKIKYYLKYGKYPNGADRAEKSRLRSAATHYKLLDGDKLMLKDKEVISDPARQYEIARNVHVMHHGGINKTTATIAEKYHWSRIKETVSDVIRACAECKELGKTPNPGGTKKVVASTTATSIASNVATPAPTPILPSNGPPRNHSIPSNIATTGRILALQSHDTMLSLSPSTSPSPSAYANPSDISVIPPSQAFQSTQALHHHQQQQHQQHHHHGLPPDAHHHHHLQSLHHHQVTHQPQSLHHNPHHPTHHLHNPMLQDQPNQHETHVYQPIDPQIINHHHHHPQQHHDIAFEHYHPHADFQALLSATEDVPTQPDGDVPPSVDTDLEMLIEHDAVDDDVDDVGGPNDHHGNHVMSEDDVMVDGLTGGPQMMRRIGHRDGRGIYDITFGGPTV